MQQAYETHTPKERGEEKERKTEIKNEQTNDRKKDQRTKKHNVTNSKTMVGTGKNLWKGYTSNLELKNYGVTDGENVRKMACNEREGDQI